MDTKLHVFLKDFDIAKITRSIDRIRIIIRNEEDTYKYLKAQFGLHFSHFDTTKRRNVITHHYRCFGSWLYLSNDYTRWLMTFPHESGPRPC